MTHPREDKPTELSNPNGMPEPKLITLNGYCKVQNFNDHQMEIVYHRHFPRHGHCHTDQGVPRAADIRFWDTVGLKIRCDALNNQVHFDDSYFDASMFEKKPLVSDLASRHPVSREVRYGSQLGRGGGRAQGPRSNRYYDAQGAAAAYHQSMADARMTAAL